MSLRQTTIIRELCLPPPANGWHYRGQPGHVKRSESKAIGIEGDRTAGDSTALPAEDGRTRRFALRRGRQVAVPGTVGPAPGGSAEAEANCAVRPAQRVAGRGSWDGRAGAGGSAGGGGELDSSPYAEGSGSRDESSPETVRRCHGPALLSI